MTKRQEIQTMVTVVTLSVMLIAYYGVVSLWRAAVGRSQSTMR